MIDIVAEDLKHASGAGRLTQQHTQRGGFARPIWSQQAKAGPRLDIKAETSNSGYAVELFSNITTVNDWRGVRLIDCAGSQC